MGANAARLAVNLEVEEAGARARGDLGLPEAKKVAVPVTEKTKTEAKTTGGNLGEGHEGGETADKDGSRVEEHC